MVGRQKLDRAIICFSPEVVSIFCGPNDGDSVHITSPWTDFCFVRCMRLAKIVGRPPRERGDSIFYDGANA
jgi:hypothetical protein